jgi:hypothetical protein
VRSFLVLLALIFSLNASAKSQLYFDQPQFDASKKVIVLIHGINADRHVFDKLAPALYETGFWVVRFQYDYHQSLEKSADELGKQLDALVATYGISHLTVLAHSMGGLISRRSFTRHLQTLLIDLVTAATPFGGFDSANPARFKILRILGWPWVKPCYAQLGSKSDFIKKPGDLGTNVIHLKIVTDEKDFEEQDDYVVSIKNQTNPVVDQSPQISNIILIHSGHDMVLSKEIILPLLVNSELQTRR